MCFDRFFLLLALDFSHFLLFAIAHFSKGFNARGGRGRRFITAEDPANENQQHRCEQVVKIHLVSDIRGYKEDERRPTHDHKECTHTNEKRVLIFHACILPLGKSDVYMETSKQSTQVNKFSPVYLCTCLPVYLPILLNQRANLLVHVKRKIVMPARVLAAGAGAFPAAERLEARPCASGCALRAIRIIYACLDVIKEPVGFFEGAIEASGETVVHVIGDLHGFVHALYLANRSDGQEHLMFPQAMGERQVGDKGVFTVIPFIEHSACLYIAADEEFSATLIDLFTEVFEI